MTDSKPYSKREMDLIMKGVNEKLTEISESLKNIDNKVTAISDQNIQFKEETKDLPTIRQSVVRLENYKWWIVGIGATFMILGGTIYYLIYDKLTARVDASLNGISNVIDDKINRGIQSAFDQRFSSIKIER